MNVLILSAGTRNTLVRYFKETIDGNVIAADMQSLAPALFDADRCYIVPPITDKRYIDVILDICKRESVRAVLSLIDPELGLLAENRERFLNTGVTVIGSSPGLCEMALDKMKLYRWLTEHGYPCAESYDDREAFYNALDKGTISFPVTVKPVRGSASKAVYTVGDREALETLLDRTEGMMIQRHLSGQEIGADVYVDLISGDTVSVFTKKKLLMRAGETDKSVSFKDPELFELIERFVTECGWRGEIDIDIFELNGRYYISEVNPRFGGGYPHAHACGCNHIRLIENNINGKVNVKSIGDYEEGVYMMKYSDITVRKENA